MKSDFRTAGEALSKSIAYIWRTLNHEAFEKAQKELLNANDGYPDKPTSGIVVFGSGVMSAVTATKAAELVAKQKVSGGVYFTGGAIVRNSSFANLLIPKMVKFGYPEPKSAETEADYMKRIFQLELTNRLISHNGIKIKCDHHSQNTAQNCTLTARMGAENKSSLSLVTLPYHALRTIATWRKQVSESQPLRPIMAWPERELGITPQNWPTSLLALYIAIDEIPKILGATPVYVQKEFCSRPNPSRDKHLFESMNR